MPPKVADRLKALQARAAALATNPAPVLDEVQEVDTDIQAASSHFGSFLPAQQRIIQKIPVGHIAPDLREGRRQSRWLPLPDELLQAQTEASLYTDVAAELRLLGDSLREQQIQPIVVFPGESEQYPAARFLILVGHRRWTAASLSNLETLDAIVIDEPAPPERILLQYTENEAREEFSDMERAWSLLQMKQALDDAPWEAVESRMQLSRARRQQLLRLMAFNPEQQQEIAQLRLQETQIRSLHSALRNGDLHAEQADRILQRLTAIAMDRGIVSRQVETGASEQDSPQPRRTGIDGPTIARLVAKERGNALPSVEHINTVAFPQWLVTLLDQLTRTQRDLQRAHGKMNRLTDVEAAQLHTTLVTLQEEISQSSVLIRDREEG